MQPQRVSGPVVIVLEHKQVRNALVRAQFHGLGARHDYAHFTRHMTMELIVTPLPEPVEPPIESGIRSGNRFADLCA